MLSLGRLNQRVNGLIRHSTRGWWILIALCATALVYFPGLSGSFHYDDLTFVVGNPGIRVTTHALGDWVAAAVSFPSGAHQGRWLTMLSFAGNHYFTGLDPFWFKLTNLGIHLLNGLLLFLALRALVALVRQTRPASNEIPRFKPDLACTAIAGLWLVLPVNLTAVLYISQRLESLSATFVFLGLWWYLRARCAHWRGERSARGLWASLIVCTGIGVLAKESAVMLPLYAACVEFVVTRARDQTGRWSRSVLALYVFILVLPLLVGLIWLAGWMHGPQTYGRSFDAIERLLTEARVLVDYIVWTLTPSLDALTLYHDDIAVSRGLLDPPTTLASLTVLAAMFAGAIWQRQRRPLFAIGIFWFFSGHLLTATVIPLLLAFEHRNYFPSAGLLLAAASLISLEGPLQRPVARAALATCLFAFYAGTTFVRAREWADPEKLIMSEAAKRPNSAAAQYERASTLFSAAARTHDDRMTNGGLLVLERNRHLPGAGINYEQLLITTSAKLGKPIDPAWWTDLISKLRAKPANDSDVKSLANLNGCFMERICPGDLTPLGEAYDAALAHGRPLPVLLQVHAEFAWWLLNNQILAEDQLRAVTELLPHDFDARRNLAVAMIARGELENARRELDTLRQMNYFGIFDQPIAQVEIALQKKQREQNAR